MFFKGFRIETVQLSLSTAISGFLDYQLHTNLVIVLLAGKVAFYIFIVGAGRVIAHVILVPRPS